MKYLILMLLIACGKESDYVYKNTKFDSKITSESHAVVGDGGQVDILWVIDNSGSMSDIQNDVIDNADKFMQEFIKNKQLDWKMGLLSTDESEEPYIGFATPFTRQDPDPVGNFRAAVSRLGIYGSGTEMSFTPIMEKLAQFQGFLRPAAHLVIIFVTDEREQSSVDATRFISDTVGRKGGRSKLVKAYGAFHATDFGCNNSYPDQVTYGGSPFEAVINAFGGKAYSTCAPDFGLELAKLGNDIVAAISSPVILLSKRPLPETIKVTYKGQELPAGPESLGGLWVYDSEANGVRFHNMDFVDFNERFVKIDFKPDQGQ